MKTLIALLLATTPAFAQVALPKSELAPQVQQKLTTTALVLDEPDSYCTVTPITNDGYMLTALHCLRTCLSEIGAGESASSPSIGLFDIFVSKISRSGGIACPNLSVPALGIKGVTVVATGSALTQYDSNFMFNYTTYYNELKTAGFATLRNDFAILKVSPRAPLKCLPLAPNGAAAGATVYAVGYPLPDNEKVKPTLQVSGGRVYAGAQDSKMFAAANEKERTYLSALYSEPGVLYSSAFTQFGQSGGPVITADGSIVGVVSGYTATGKPEVHELVAVSSTSFLSALPAPLAQELVRKSASCR